MFVPRNDFESEINRIYFCGEDGVFWPSCKRLDYIKKYNELKLVNHVQTNKILLIEKFTYRVFVQKSLVECMYT